MKVALKKSVSKLCFNSKIQQTNKPAVKECAWQVPASYMVAWLSHELPADNSALQQIL